MKDAEKANLEARAQYVLSQSIVEDILVAGPTLNAVHRKDTGVSADGYITATKFSLWKQADIYNRDLQQLLERRDKLGIASTNQASQLRNTTREITKVKAGNIRTREKNRELEAKLLSLNKKIEAQREDVSKDPRFKERLQDARQETATAKKHWRMMKSVVSGVIAASGVDWAHDETLRELVLDDEDEEDDR